MKTEMKRRALLLTFVFSLLTMGIFAQQHDSDPAKVEKTQKVQSQGMQKPASAVKSDRDINLAPPPPPPPPPPVQPSLEQADEPPTLTLPDMTSEQKEKVKKSDLKQIEAITPFRNQMREKKARLNTVLTTQPVNIKDADMLADEIGQIHISILKLQISHDQELRNLLTKDQQVVFDSRQKPFLTMGK